MSYRITACGLFAASLGPTMRTTLRALSQVLSPLASAASRPWAAPALATRATAANPNFIGETTGHTRAAAPYLLNPPHPTPPHPTPPSRHLHPTPTSPPPPRAPRPPTHPPALAPPGEQHVYGLADMHELLAERPRGLAPPPPPAQEAAAHAVRFTDDWLRPVYAPAYAPHVTPPAADDGATTPDDGAAPLADPVAPGVAGRGAPLQAVKRTFQPSTVRRKRQHGFLVRKRSKDGRDIMKRRFLKGRKRLSC